MFDVRTALTYILPVDSYTHPLPDTCNDNHDTSEKITQLVLAGQATGWTAMAHAVRNFDEEKVKDCKEDVDTLLVFVCGLSSCTT